MPLFLVTVLEAALHLAGYGFDPHFFLRLGSGPTASLADNPRFGWRFFPRGMARTPRPLSTPVAKPENTVRIAILGESAAMGDPEPAYGFPRILETLLNAHFPGKRFEVINTAMTAINSHVILPIARDSREASPDFWIIYMGNNEVVGPFGAGTVFGAQVPPLGLIRARITLGASRLGQWAGGLIKPSTTGETNDEAWGGMEMFLANQIRRDDPRMASVYRHFEANLESILAVGKSAGIKTVVCTVASNLRDCPPFGSAHRHQLNAKDLADWEKTYGEAIAAQTANRWNEAIAKYQAAGQLDPEFAEGHFRWGQCLLAVGDVPGARSQFSLARDLDTLRFRTDSALNDLIRQTTQRQGGHDEATLLDVEQVLEQAAPQGIPDSTYFVDHVHFTFAGNYKVALETAKTVMSRLRPTVVTEPANEWLSAEGCAQRLGWNDWSDRLVTEDLYRRFQRPPFTLQLAHSNRLASLKSRLNEFYRVPRKEAFNQAVKAGQTALGFNPDDWLLHEKLGEIYRDGGDYQSAVKEWEQVVARMPRHAGVFNNLGIALNALGRPEEAEARFRTALGLDPLLVEALNGVGLSLAQRRQFPVALREFERAKALKPGYLPTYINISLALEASGQKERAVDQYLAVLPRFSANPVLHANLGRLLASQGRTNEALPHLQEAVRLAPGNALAHFNLGNFLLASGDLNGAVEHFATAASLDARSLDARINLGVCLIRAHRSEEALAPLQEAVTLSPQSINARLSYGIALRENRRLDESRTQFREVLRVEPTNVSAKRQLESLNAGPETP
ncbi:MAG TPA: tetratricopeptide repeat protein [Candidatus Limnocylindria bacterium]|nr:tetratricopeptide repeat protein [Candidatus Limnocylindria bacterium]